jgi:hypothetical protein
LHLDKAHEIADRMIKHYKNPNPKVILQALIIDLDADFPYVDGPGALYRPEYGGCSIIIHDEWVINSKPEDFVRLMKHMIAHYFSGTDVHDKKWTESFRRLIRQSFPLGLHLRWNEVDRIVMQDASVSWQCVHRDAP